MKTNFKTIALAFIAFASFSITSCSNDDDDNSTPAVDNTIAGIASRNADLTLLVKALTKAGLVSTLQGAGPFTVFAPNNQAFTDAGYTSATIDALPASEVPALRAILLNHVVSGAVQSSGLVNNSYIKTLATTTQSGTNTLSMYVTTTGGVKLNGGSDTVGGANVTNANISASNGVIHLVNKVITLPNIVKHASINPAFTTLVSLLNRPDQPNFVNILGGNGPFTVFAPINDAFTALDTELQPGGIASVSADNITKVLQYHVAEGNKLSSTLTNNLSVGTVLGQSFTMQTTTNPFSVKIKDVRDRIIDVVITDVQCSNGVVHVPTRVLLPNF